MQLGFGITFPDLYERDGLIKVDAAFLAFLGEADRTLADRLNAARAKAPSGLAESQLLIALAPHVEDFVARLFRIEREARALAERHNELAPLYAVKRQFVQRRALHKVKPADLEGFEPVAAQERLFGRAFTELEFARRVSEWLANESENAELLELAARYAAWATLTPAGKEKHRGGVLFKTPHKLDYMKLIPVPVEPRHREGFALT